MLNAIDRFIASLWSRNDQLCVYNPLLKTLYDTHSWARNINSSNSPGIAKALEDYKLDLLISLEHDDNLPRTYARNGDGVDFMSVYLSRDIRNMLKWIRKSQPGFGKESKIDMTYEDVMTYIDGPPPIPLGSRDLNDPDGTGTGTGFLFTPFYEMVQEKFEIGRYGTSFATPVFEGSIREDSQFAFSGYFWFMYGILPRNNISFMSLKRGLTQRRDLEKDDIPNTIKFLCLVFNIPTDTITIDGPDGDNVKDLKLINPTRDVARPITREKITIEQNMYLRQNQNENRDGKDRKEGDGKSGGDKTNDGLNDIDKNPDVVRIQNKLSNLEAQFKKLKETEKSANSAINIGTEMNTRGTKLYELNEKVKAAQTELRNKKDELKKKSPGVTTGQQQGKRPPQR